MGLAMIMLMSYGVKPVVRKQDGDDHQPEETDEEKEEDDEWTTKGSKE